MIIFTQIGQNLDVPVLLIWHQAYFAMEHIALVVNVTGKEFAVVKVAVIIYKEPQDLALLDD